MAETQMTLVSSARFLSRLQYLLATQAQVSGEASNV